MSHTYTHIHLNKWWENWTATEAHFHTLCTKINSASIKDMKIWPETIKFLEENIDSTLLALVLSICFGYVSPQARATKAKINKWKHIKLNFYTAKISISKQKGTYWQQKKFAKYMSNIDLSPKYIKAHINAISIKIQFKNTQRVWIGTFQKGIHTDSQQAHENMLNIANHQNTNKTTVDNTSHLSKRQP